MAFTYTILGQTIFGDKRIVYGTFTSNGGSTGGDILTGLTVLENLQCTLRGASAAANALAINETFPLSGGAATIVTLADLSGTFLAIGN